MDSEKSYSDFFYNILMTYEEQNKALIHKRILVDPKYAFIHLNEASKMALLLSNKYCPLGSFSLNRQLNELSVVDDYLEQMDRLIIFHGELIDAFLYEGKELIQPFFEVNQEDINAFGSLIYKAQQHIKLLIQN
jgi:hypothetical protein